MSFSRFHASRTRLLAILCLCAVVLCGVATPAQAGPLSSANIIVLDDGVDVDPLKTVLTYAPGGGPGAYSLTITGKTTDFSFSQVFTTSNQPGSAIFGAKIVDSQTDVTQTAAGAHRFEVRFSDNGFTIPAGPNSILTSTGTIIYSSGTSTSDYATLQSYADPGNVLFATTVTSGLQTADKSDANDGNSSVFKKNTAKSPKFGTVTYSITSDTIVYSNEQNANYQVQSSSVVTTPEPTSMALICIGVVGMAGYRLRRRKSEPKQEEIAIV